MDGGGGAGRARHLRERGRRGVEPRGAGQVIQRLAGALSGVPPRHPRLRGALP